MCKKSKIVAAVIVAIPLLFSQFTLAQSALVSNQSSVVANSIKSEAQNCANGAAGTIGSSIGTAMQIHTEMASATPNVETLFDVANDCFSGVSNIFDLSFSIPSLSSILNAAKDAVMQYAQKKICSAATQVTGMVTNPLNQAISNVNGYGSIGDLNGLSNNLVKSGMSQIDPNLGASYSGGGGGNNYTVGTNPFNSQQTEFSNGNSNSNASQIIGNCSAQISTLNHDIFAQQQQVISLTNQYNSAKAAADSCHASMYTNGGNCYSVDMAAASLQNQLNAAQQSVTTLQQNLANLSSSPSCSASAASPSMILLSPTSNSAAPAPTESESSWTNSILNIFN